MARFSEEWVSPGCIASLCIKWTRDNELSKSHAWMMHSSLNSAGRTIEFWMVSTYSVNMNMVPWTWSCFAHTNRVQPQESPEIWNHVWRSDLRVTSREGFFLHACNNVTGQFTLLHCPLSTNETVFRKSWWVWFLKQSSHFTDYTMGYLILVLRNLFRPTVLYMCHIALPCDIYLVLSAASFFRYR